MAKITWLGDEDPSVQQISQFGVTFVKGEPSDVPADHPQMGAFKENRFFHVRDDDKGKPEVVPGAEPEPVNPEVGTEVDAARTALDGLGVKYRANASLDSLRSQLAEAQAALPQQKAEGTAQ